MFIVKVIFILSFLFIYVFVFPVLVKFLFGEK